MLTKHCNDGIFGGKSSRKGAVGREGAFCYSLCSGITLLDCSSALWHGLSGAGVEKRGLMENFDMVHLDH